MKTKNLLMVCIASIAFVSCGGDDYDKKIDDIVDRQIDGMIDSAICDALRADGRGDEC